MNSVTAVLLALVLIAVVLLIVWLVLRSRSTDQPPGSALSPPGAADPDPSEVPEANPLSGQRPGDLGSADATAADESDSSMSGGATAGPLDEDPKPHPHGGDGALGQEDDPASTSEQEGSTVVEGVSDPDLGDPHGAMIDDEGDAAPAGAPPRTPTEAFGAAAASADPGTHEAASRETSALDAPTADSTPLFRSIREELKGSPPAEEQEPSAPSEPVETALVEDVVAEQPELDRTWSHERRGWDEQAHDEHPVLRVSELHEVVDGGFGIGSAATIADGAQPLGHPIKANLDTKTYQDLHSPWYDETDPDVWFLDVGFAERAGFRRAE